MQQHFEESDQSSATTDGLLPAAVIEEVERADAVRAALSELDETARDVLVNKYVDSMSVAEIADRIGKSPKAVESMLTRARTRLRSLLRSYFPQSMNVARESL